MPAVEPVAHNCTYELHIHGHLIAIYLFKPHAPIPLSPGIEVAMPDLNTKSVRITLFNGH